MWESPRPQRQEVERHGGGNEQEQHDKEFALLNQISPAGLKDDLRHLEHRLMGSQLLDLVAQKQADTQRTSDDARAIEQKIPWSDTPQQGIWSALMQVGYREICLAREHAQRDEEVSNHHQQHSLQLIFQSHNALS